MAVGFGYCMVSAAPLRADKKDQSEIVSQLLFGEIVSIIELDAPWMKITTFTDNYSGYVDHKHIRRLTEKEMKRWMDGLSYSSSISRKLLTPWGTQLIYRGSFVPEGLDKFNIGNDSFEWMELVETLPNSPVEMAEQYINTPYLWGGKSPFGIDCSGLTQVVYRFYGFNLPRDASEQVEHGNEVHIDEIQEGDLAYFNNNSGRITHVGILDGKGDIIHASGHVRKDQLTKQGIYREDINSITHPLYTIKRL